MDSGTSKIETIPLPKGDLDLIELINEIEELSKDTSSNALVREYIQNVKTQILDTRTYYKDEELLEIIQKHPYFKNPCKYPIRMISIMKHLKKKGVDVEEKDMDLRVDRLISELPNIERIEFGRYHVNKY